MLLPQLQEEDVFNNTGQQTDDINSVVEYIAVALGYDHTLDDEDDDSGQNFHIAKTCEYNYQPFFSLVNRNLLVRKDRVSFTEFEENQLELIYFDIATPPPKA